MGEVISWLSGDTTVARWAICLLIAFVVVQSVMINSAIKAMRESTSLLRDWAGAEEDPNA